MKTEAFKGQLRGDLGRRSAATARRSGFLPVNIYGHKQDNLHVTIDFKAFEKFLQQGHRILTIEIDGKEEHGVVKEIQYDSLGTTIIHADVARVDLEEKIILSVPVVTLGIAKGQSAGGILVVNIKELKVEGPANAIPEKIEIAVAALEIEQAIRIKDLQPPPQCRFDHPEDVVVLAIEEKREILEPEAPAEGAEMPEVIGRKPKEEEEGEEGEPAKPEGKKEPKKEKEKE